MTDVLASRLTTVSLLATCITSNFIIWLMIKSKMCIRDRRISIARAVLKDAPVILLDEATASLDVENETAVQAALSRLVRDKTCLLYTSRCV